jgi:hypothetical protein
MNMDYDDDPKDPRANPPFDVDIDWKTKRDRARILELLVGYTLYCTTTGGGALVLFGFIAGVVGAYFGARALLR